MSLQYFSCGWNFTTNCTGLVLTLFEVNTCSAPNLSEEGMVSLRHIFIQLF